MADETYRVVLSELRHKDDKSIFSGVRLSLVHCKSIKGENNLRNSALSRHNDSLAMPLFTTLSTKIMFPALQFA